MQETRRRKESSPAAPGRAQAAVARGIKDECEAELAVALPILADALAALDTIKEPDVAYMRKLGNPPAAIKLVLEARTRIHSAGACQAALRSGALWHAIHPGCTTGVQCARHMHRPHVARGSK